VAAPASRMVRLKSLISEARPTSHARSLQVRAGDDRAGSGLRRGPLSDGGSQYEAQRRGTDGAYPEKFKSRKPGKAWRLSSGRIGPVRPVNLSAQPWGDTAGHGPPSLDLFSLQPTASRGPSEKRGTEVYEGRRKSG
jgi:hypothetical protein